MKKIKVLEVIPSLTRANGINSFLINYQKNIDKNRFEITYLVVRNRHTQEFYEEYTKNGGKVKEIFLDDGILKFVSRIKQFFKANKFDIAHCNVPNIAFIVLKYAKKNGVAVRINHAHGSKSSERLLQRKRNDLLIKIGNRYATDFFACSELAGKRMFKNKNCIVIKNAIDYSDVVFNAKKRAELRKKLNLDKSIVIGNVGRYQEAKNQTYILKIVKELSKSNKDIVAVLIGGGILENKLKDEIRANGLEENVKLLGCRRDVKDLYNAMDIFVFPSIAEGLPVAVIEAQVNGLQCLISDTVTKEVSISDRTTFLPIGENNISEWVTSVSGIINSNHGERNEGYKTSDAYEIKKAVKNFEMTLDNLLKKRKTV